MPIDLVLFSLPVIKYLDKSSSGVRAEDWEADGQQRGLRGD